MGDHHSAGRYSVYDRKTDMPLCIYATAKECAAFMGISLNSFHRYVCWQRKNRNTRKWVVYRDERDDDGK